MYNKHAIIEVKKSAFIFHLLNPPLAYPPSSSLSGELLVVRPRLAVALVSTIIFLIDGNILSEENVTADIVFRLLKFAKCTDCCVTL